MSYSWSLLKKPFKDLKISTKVHELYIVKKKEKRWRFRILPRNSTRTIRPLKVRLTKGNNLHLVVPLLRDVAIRHQKYGLIT